MDDNEEIHHNKYTKDYESPFEGSSLSSSSSSEIDLTEDDETSSSSSSSGPLYRLSDMIDQLPIKRGLSKHYQGKSRTFTSLSSVRSLEDLVKKRRTRRRKIKPCKSYGGGLESRVYRPKAIISKKKICCVSLLSVSETRRVGTVFSSFGFS